MWKIESTHDDVGDDEYDDHQLAFVEMNIMADEYAEQLGAHLAHLPWCTVIYDSTGQWRMMWVSRTE